MNSCRANLRIGATTIVLFLSIAGVCHTESTPLTLPTDLPTLQKQAKVTFVGFDAEHLALQVTDVAQPVAVRIPVGTWLKPVAGENAPAFLVWKEANFVVQPGPVPVNYPFGVVFADIYQWGTPTRDARWNAFPPGRSLSQGRLAAFYEAANTDTNLTWADAQIGTAAILQNVSVASLYSKKVTVRELTPGATNTVEVGIYTYATVCQVQALFKKAGLHPDDYRVFADNEENLERVLRAYTVSSWSDELLVPHTGDLFSGLVGYGSSPRVRELLLAYVQHHQDEYHAWQAALGLIEINGLTGSNDELFQQATADPHRFLRFAAAATLSRRQDWRAMPLLAAFSQDELLIGPFEKTWTAQFTRQFGIQRRPEETLLQFWERAGGWDWLALDHDVTALKAAVAKLQTLEDADLHTRLNNALSAGGRNLAAALTLLSRRFPRHPQLAAWVSQIARTYPDPNIRMLALLSLRNLPPADHCDLLADRLNHDPAAAVRVAAVYVPWSPDPHRRAGFFLWAVHDPDPQVCLGVVRQLDKEAFTPAASTVLTVLARTGATTDLRIAVLNKLVSFGVTNAAALVREAIATTDPQQQDVAVEALRLWAQIQPDAEGLALMKQTATHHPLAPVRAAALNNLDAYSRAKLPVMDIALECVTNDADASVQMSAVSLALLRLAQAGEKQLASQVIAAGLNSRHLSIRARAVKIVAAQQLTALEPRVVEIAKTEPDSDTQVAAYDALQQLKSTALLDILATWTRSANPVTRRAAVQELARQFANNPRARTLVEPLANDPNDEVQWAATKFLKSGAQ